MAFPDGSEANQSQPQASRIPLEVIALTFGRDARRSGPPGVRLFMWPDIGQKVAIAWSIGPGTQAAWCLAMTRILVVDDDLSVRSVVGDALRQEGYEVDAVGTAGRPSQLSGSTGPTRWCSISRCPSWTAPTLVRTLRERTKWGACPGRRVGHGKRNERWAQLGAQAFLSKPFELSELLGSVERVVPPD